jgi:hypothetical protein
VRFYSLLIFFALLLGSTTLMAQGQQVDEDPRNRRGSQIVDDSTRQIYGPRTSRYFYERDVFLNQDKFNFIDTAISGFHRFTYVEKYHHKYQDLGNIGTAIRPIFYQTPKEIGVSSGFSQYDLYWDEEEIRYYDTKSPYSNMRVILGGKGRSITRANYSRNINPNWNFGFNFRGVFIDKQIQRQGKGDRNARGTYYDLYTTYQSADSTYRLFANMRRNRVFVNESGGVQVENNDFSLYKNFFFVNARPQLLNAKSEELRMNFHLYHHYKIGNGLQLYHQFDRSRQGNKFEDVLNVGNEFFDFTVVDSSKVHDFTKFKTVRNEVGIKGNFSKFFYNGYVAFRNFSLTNRYLEPSEQRIALRGTETYLGGRIGVALDSVFTLQGWAEVMETGNYRIEGTLDSKWLTASVKQLQHAPSYLLQTYRGSHDVWYNNFSDVQVSELKGALHYRNSFLKVSPGISLTRLNNYVFFKFGDYPSDQRVLPVQADGDQVFTSPQVNLQLTIAKHIFIRGEGIYTAMLNNTEAAFQIPELFGNAEISYENIFFNDNLDMHAGVDVHWHSAYYAPGYDVPTQQFYIQQQYKTPSFPLTSVFFSARIKRGRIFVKYNNLVQAITKEGYMPTPFYPGQRNVIDFGFDWSFYD